MELAKESFLKDEVPVGAVVVKENKIIGSGRNTVIADIDVSSHAEINALRSASKKLNEFKLIELGNLMYQSHEGLKDLYEVSCKELDFLVELTKPYNQIIGSRMMGGGFGGCTINLIHKKFKNEFIEKASKIYLKNFGIDLTEIEINICDGVKIKNLQTD